MRKKVLVVDDSAFYRQTITGILKDDSRFDVIGTAANGSEAIQFLSHEVPDVITLDLEMPQMDGFTFLRWIVANKPLPVVVISSLSESNNILKALELGAVEFVGKPTQKASLEFLRIKPEILDKVWIASTVSSAKIESILKAKTFSRNSRRDKAFVPLGEMGKIKLLAIGASTGGPPAIQSIIHCLPENFPVPVVISQHMPRGFTHYFAERLNNVSKVKVKEGEEGDSLAPGTVIIAPGGCHMLLKSASGSNKVTLNPKLEADKYSPSIDQMLFSAVQCYGKGVLAVILTGMGSDGKLGVQAVKENGGLTIAESEESCVVYGMPKEVVDIGAAEKILPLEKIPGEIIRMCASE